MNDEYGVCACAHGKSDHRFDPVDRHGFCVECPYEQSHHEYVSDGPEDACDRCGFTTDVNRKTMLCDPCAAAMWDDDDTDPLVPEPPTLRRINIGPLMLAFYRFGGIPSMVRDYPIFDGWLRKIDESDHFHYGAALAIRIGWWVHEVEATIAFCEREGFRS